MPIPVNRALSLDQVLEPVAEELVLFERELASQLQCLGNDGMRSAALSRLGERAVRHPFRAAGKRLRPAVVLLSAASVGGLGRRRDALLKLAVGVELIHTASLVHDDIIDESRTRRGRPSANARYGNRIAVLAGDILYTQFFAVLGGLPEIDPAGKLRLLALFAEVTKRMCFGEIYEERILSAGSGASWQDYLSMIESKTASLLSACCEAGALVSGAGEPEVRALRAFGRSLGMAYQLLDDLADGDAASAPDDRRLLDEADRFLAHARESLRPLRRNPAAERLGDLLSFVRLHGSAASPREAHQAGGRGPMGRRVAAAS